MAVNLTDMDIGTRYALQEDFNNGFVGRDRQVVIQTDDPKGYRPVIMDGATTGGKNKVALVDDLSDYVPVDTYNSEKAGFATKTELSSYETTTHASATYETKANATATYATKSELATKIDNSVYMREVSGSASAPIDANNFWSKTEEILVNNTDGSAEALVNFPTSNSGVLRTVVQDTDSYQIYENNKNRTRHIRFNKGNTNSYTEWVSCSTVTVNGAFPDINGNVTISTYGVPDWSTSTRKEGTSFVAPKNGYVYVLGGDLGGRGSEGRLIVNEKIVDYFRQPDEGYGSHRDSMQCIVAKGDHVSWNNNMLQCFYVICR